MASAERWIGSRQRWSGRRARPSAPEARRRGDARVRLVDVLRHHEILGPGERAVGLLALLEHVARAHAVTLDAERHVLSLTVRSAPRPSAVWRSSPTSDHSAGTLP
jgi:hypothetical protein